MLTEERFVVKGSCCAKSSIDMGRFVNNIHVVEMFVLNMAKIPGADSNSTMITHYGAPTGTEEPDNRSKDFSELFV